jgi:hypothetical protein
MEQTMNGNFLPLKCFFRFGESCQVWREFRERGVSAGAKDIVCEHLKLLQKTPKLVMSAKKWVK